MKLIRRMVNQKFNRLLVIQFSHIDKKGNKYWLCECDCGTIKPISEKGLKNNNPKSCSCLQKERTTKHNKWRHPLYPIWAGMKARCFNPNHEAYHSYGGRGITVCKRWLNIDNFIMDMGERPEGMQLDRKDNDKSYSKSNCKWSTTLDNSLNKRNTVYYTFDNKTLPLVTWAKIMGIGEGVLRNRVQSNCPPEKIFKVTANLSKQILSFDGLNLTLSEWSKKLNVKISILAWRFKTGWSPNEILYGR